MKLNTKICTKCGKEKDFSEFYKAKRGLFGLRGQCKKCREEYKKEYIRKQKSIKKPKFKLCTKCKKIKNINDFFKKEDGKYGLRSDCKECDCKRYRKYAQTEIGKESQKRRSKKYRKSEKYKQKWEEYKKTNKYKIKDKIRWNKWIKTEKGKLAQAKKDANKRARNKLVINDLTLEQWKVILKKQKHKCNICNKKFNKHLKPTRDHIIPLIKGGGLTKDNVQALCVSCNSSKGTKILN